MLGIAFFSLGEMWTGPKKNEYLGLIAPPGKKGLYLGYVNIPVGVGVFAGSWLAGWVYGHYGEKAMLALRYLARARSAGLDESALSARAISPLLNDGTIGRSPRARNSNTTGEGR